MKIERGKKELRGFSLLGKADSREIKRGSGNSFEQELSQKREAESQLRMQEILKNLEKLEKQMKHNVNINDLMLYKKLIRDFLQEATAKVYFLQKERGRNRRGRTMLTTISIIDQEVEQLINNFVSKKKEAVEILTTLDKIRGMLVDLMI
ncbi:MAG: YaaR family protein [Syntrophomonas sp.]|uniref:YaaR family protein n=1 Tax=Syntrophomonas sp. TaxID=2053627 RepID=UPI002615E194|nr:YaaR family protein [Syntrophomonas sp.]MDD2510548.1 YaaR family protein [Syntrophomonas sp.]MDD3879032.1 YaaR family protein [Syntrophomonas sp.]MDD4626369.1 YaaR family protein [Syntrophomonas sp.]